jgi:hypothetical protein
MCGAQRRVVGTLPTMVPRRRNTPDRSPLALAAPPASKRQPPVVTVCDRRAIIPATATTEIRVMSHMPGGALFTAADAEAAAAAFRDFGDGPWSQRCAAKSTITSVDWCLLTVPLSPKNSRSIALRLQSRKANHPSGHRDPDPCDTRSSVDAPRTEDASHHIVTIRSAQYS